MARSTTHKPNSEIMRVAQAVRFPGAGEHELTMTYAEDAHGKATCTLSDAGATSRSDTGSNFVAAIRAR